MIYLENSSYSSLTRFNSATNPPTSEANVESLEILAEKLGIHTLCITADNVNSSNHIPRRVRAILLKEYSIGLHIGPCAL